MFNWRRPGNLGVKNGRLAPCRRTPNCVSSQADPADQEHYIAPLEANMEDLKKAVAALPRTRIIAADSRYLYAEFRSRLLRYVDDVEFLADGNVIHVRSASRLGRRDFGVNRGRIERIRRLLRPAT
jgi:uncharacterized protein (DUF1499 family)